MTRQQVFAELRRRGISKVVCGFSGGNDEGGVDSMEATDGEGNIVEGFLSRETYVHRTYSEGDQVFEDGTSVPKGVWVVHVPDAPKVKHPRWGSDVIPVRRATEEEVSDSSLTEALEEPCHSRYGSFAGDFYVSGTYTWDVATGQVVADWNEQVSHYEGRSGTW
jgi:hypothetical protein